MIIVADGIGTMLPYMPCLALSSARYDFIEAKVELELNVTHHAYQMRRLTSEILSRRRMRLGSPESARDEYIFWATNFNEISPRQSNAQCIRAMRGPAFNGARGVYLS